MFPLRTSLAFLASLESVVVWWATLLPRGHSIVEGLELILDAHRQLGTRLDAILEQDPAYPYVVLRRVQVMLDACFVTVDRSEGPVTLPSFAALAYEIFSFQVQRPTFPVTWRMPGRQTVGPPATSAEAAAKPSAGADDRRARALATT